MPQDEAFKSSRTTAMEMLFWIHPEGRKCFEDKYGLATRADCKKV
jgi:hypothetical protein